MANPDLLQSLQMRLQQLEDKEALSSLLNRYCEMLDDHKWNDFSKCFITEGILGYEGWGEVVGPEKIAAVTGGAEDRFQGLQHSMTNVQFEVDGDKATGTCYLLFLATMDTSKPHEYHAFGGPYKFNFVRCSAGWKIARMQLKKIWAQNEDTQGVFG